MAIADSELIINPDGSIYHLNLLPGDLAETIITVGDQERVHQVSDCFDSIEISKHKREFSCHTGHLGGKRLSVISTGIGTDNIDIVFNEIDALFNVDFKTRTIKENLTQLTFIRLGTSGCIQEDIALDQLLVSEIGIGTDNLNNFYDLEEEYQDKNLEQALGFVLGDHFNIYTVKSDASLTKHFLDHGEFIPGCTFTAIGFYGPQGRNVRSKVKNERFLDYLANVQWDGKKVTNFEMETSGMYLLAHNLGHQALSVNVLIANRAKGTFSKSPKEAVKRMIQKSLEVIKTL